MTIARATIQALSEYADDKKEQLGDYADEKKQNHLNKKESDLVKEQKSINREGILIGLGTIHVLGRFLRHYREEKKLERKKAKFQEKLELKAQARGFENHDQYFENKIQQDTIRVNHYTQNLSHTDRIVNASLVLKEKADLEAQAQELTNDIAELKAAETTLSNQNSNLDMPLNETQIQQTAITHDLQRITARLDEIKDEQQKNPDLNIHSFYQPKKDKIEFLDRVRQIIAKMDEEDSDEEMQPNYDVPKIR